MGKMKKNVVLILKMVLLGIIFYFLGKNIYSNLGALRQYSWDIAIHQMGISLLFLFLGFALMVGIWLYIMRCMGERITFARGWRIWFISNLGRYIPGKFWQIAGLIWLAGEDGISRRIAGASLIIGHALSIVSSLVMFIFLIGSGTELLSPRLLIALMLLIVLLLCTVYPRNLERLLNIGLRFLGKEMIEVRLTLNHIIYIFFLYLCGWILYGIAFYFFVNSLVHVPYDRLPETVSIFAISYVLGFIVVIAPGGLGVREGVMTVLLSQIVPASLAAGISIFARVWATAVEGLCVLIAFTIPGKEYVKEKTKVTT